MIPEYLLRAILASIVVSVLLGTLSPLINTKGLAFLTHALFHALLFGAVLGMILGLLLSNIALVTATALIVTVLVVLLIAWLERAGFSPDSAVGIVASFVAGLTVLGFGVLYRVMASRPYFPLSQNIVSYLTGEIFLISLNDLTVLVFGGALLFFVLLLLYRDFLYLSFDPEGIESYGGNVGAYLMTLYVLVGATGALIVQTVGLITLQVVAVLPGAIALMVSSNVRKVLAVSVALTLAVQLSSVALAYLTDIPPSGLATIMLGVVYGGLLLRGVKA
ncbi:ABC transporter [Thermococcus sp. P6]|uniref:metal ABC transporter permease n=1 Tax=Thermococcus sp. P6 TaxID=122420 RepID=UPI000B59C332|nr:metal ABC transporter permease [Thermococcus sp. P6]ASJ11225.1 ABC transporter [Thermococcus sp. P6]